LLLFADGKTHADYEALRLEESALFAGGDYLAEQVTPHEVMLGLQGPLSDAIVGADPGDQLRVAKTLKFNYHENGFDAVCRLDLTRTSPASPAAESSKPRRFTVGLEMVVNLLAPNAHDRYFEIPAGRQPLAWSGVVEGSRLRMVDEWQDVAVEIEARNASQVWVAPIETVSESEEGFERVYQGSQILGIWTVDLKPSEAWSAEAVLQVTPAREP
jgi:hypothetical protein